MRKTILALALIITSLPAFAMFGAQIDEKVPNLNCHTEMTFGNGQVREYDLNTYNVFHRATRTDHMWTLDGKADSTGNKMRIILNDTNKKGTIIYYSDEGKPFGKGDISCK